MKKINKFILTKDQIEIIKRVHRQIIMDGLVELGLKREVETEIIENAERNFELMILDAQKILTEIGVMDEVREEILLEDKIEASKKKSKAKQSPKKKNGK